MGPGSILRFCVSHEVAPELQGGSSCPLTDRCGLDRSGQPGVMSVLHVMPGIDFSKC
jgi:hypothetical protein